MVVDSQIFFFFSIGKLYMHLVGFEPMTSPSNLLLQGKEMLFELDLLGSCRFSNQDDFSFT